MLQTQPATIDQFDGGITDFPIDAPVNRYSEGDNFLILSNKKLKTRPGLDFYDADKPQLPTGNQRVNTLINFNLDLICQTNRSLYREDGSDWEEITNIAGGQIFSDGDVNSQVAHTIWNEHLIVANSDFAKIVKIFKNSSGIYQAVTAGLPGFSPAPSVVGGAGALAYIYAFVRVYTYSVGDYEYVDFGPPTYVQIAATAEPSVTPVAITSIQSLANGPGDAYDTANVKTRIYRTEGNETALYQVAEISNATTTYNDTMSDATLKNNVTLYTNGDVLPNDPPPLAKFVHTANGAVWYAHIKEGSKVLSNRIMQSVIDDPDSVPSGNTLDLEFPVTGISSFGDRVVAFTKNATYRIDGVYDQFGGGEVSFQKISDSIGCISHNSIVQVPTGVVFADQDGFAYTDGFLVYRITDQLTKRFPLHVMTDRQKERIQGKFDRENRRVYWTMQEDSAALADCNKLWVLDIRWEISTESVYTTFSGGPDNADNFAPSAITFIGSTLVQADKRGYIFKYGSDLVRDRLIDLAVSTSLWGTVAIRYDLTTAATSFGEAKLRKITTRCIVQAENASNMSLLITSISDLRKKRTLQPLNYRGNLVWGDPLFKWGDPKFRWRGLGFLQEQRRFDSNDLRCTYKQIQLTNAKAIVANSDALGTVEANSTTKTMLLEDATRKWPLDMMTYVASFEDDGYVKEYPIVSRSDDTLVIQDASNTMPNTTGVKWVIRGYIKGDILSLLNLTVLYALLGQTQPFFTPESLGNNE